MKQIKLIYSTETFEMLKQEKHKLKQTWEAFVLELMRFKQKFEKENQIKFQEVKNGNQKQI